MFIFSPVLLLVLDSQLLSHLEEHFQARYKRSNFSERRSDHHLGMEVQTCRVIERLNSLHNRMQALKCWGQ